MSSRAIERQTIAARQEARVSGRRIGSKVGRRALFYGVLSVIALATLLPFIAMALLAVTPPGALKLPSLIPDEFTLKHLRGALSASSIWRWSFNSLIYAVTTIVASLFLASLAGYAFAKKKFAGRDAIFWSFVAMLMVPGQLTIVPMFILIAELHGINTYWGLILPTIANAQAVFLLRQFIRDIPDDLIEASKIDGASEWYIYSRIILPLTKPVLATLGVFIFLAQWNDFFWPLLISQSNDMRTLTVGLASMQLLKPTTGAIMAAATINFVPCFIVFAILQRYLVQGITMTGMK
jgi:multiple sugar transport system permease protein